MRNDEPAYRDRVPAVARAVKALETLAAAAHPMSLTALSKAILVSPSSLLAILTTLRHLGLVSRNTQDGRYRPGPGLIALGTAAAQSLEPLQQFDLLASELVELLNHWSPFSSSICWRASWSTNSAKASCYGSSKVMGWPWPPRAKGRIRCATCPRSGSACPLQVGRRQRVAA